MNAPQVLLLTKMPISVCGLAKLPTAGSIFSVSTESQESRDVPWEKSSIPEQDLAQMVSALIQKRSLNVPTTMLAAMIWNSRGLKT